MLDFIQFETAERRVFNRLALKTETAERRVTDNIMSSKLIKTNMCIQHLPLVANFLNNNGNYDKYSFGSDSVLASIVVPLCGYATTSIVW